MASPFETTITGRKAIITALRAIGDKGRDIAEDAVVAGVKVFEDEVRRRAPVDSGSMKRRIKTGLTRKETRVSARVITPPEAVFTEYGFIHKPGNKRVPAQPWIRPAFESKAAEVEKQVLNTMIKKIEETARANAGGGDARP